jgi:hypothetical protein
MLSTVGRDENADGEAEEKRRDLDDASYYDSSLE